MTQGWTRSLGVRWIPVAIVAVVAALLPGATAGAAAGGPKLTVMTRNLYLGSGLTNLLTATSPLELAQDVTQDWANVVATNFPARATALANEIISAQADVVGLQEVTLWRDQTPSNLVLGHLTPDATHVVYDFLTLLQNALAARGASYVPVATSVNADAESPRIDLTSPDGFTDVRLTDRDVILVRAPLAGKFSNPQHGHYVAQFSSQPPGSPVPISFVRGWTSVDYRHDARTTVRIFDTHLETEDVPPVQFAQAQEALGIIGASPYPVIVLGDFNSAADGTTTDTYALLTRSLHDEWAAARPGDPGLSCCQTELLNNPVSTANERIDLVLTTENWPADRASLTGSTPFRRSPAPLWGSDHFGVTARVTIQR
jgi:endonuclease/exonuclease/phosphatase family metal-dependent hydrolase